VNVYINVSKYCCCVCWGEIHPRYWSHSWVLGKCSNPVTIFFKTISCEHKKNTGWSSCKLSLPSSDADLKHKFTDFRPDYYCYNVGCIYKWTMLLFLFVTWSNNSSLFVSFVKFHLQDFEENYRLYFYIFVSTKPLLTKPFINNLLTKPLS